MKRPTLANENMVSLYSGRSYLSPSSKSPLQAFPKSIGITYNSPKNEVQKGFAFPQKALGTNLRASAKLEKSEPVLERKNSKNTNDSYSKVASSATLNYSSLTRPNKPRGSSTKLTSSEKAIKVDQPELGRQYGSKYSDVLGLRDALLKQSKQRTLEVETGVQAYKVTGGVKGYSTTTKSKDLQERLQSSAIGGTDVSYSGIDYTPNGKYFVNQTAVHNTNKFDYSRTEGNDEKDKQSITPTTKQKSALGRILANTSEKGNTGTIRRTNQNEDDGLYNSSSLKVNNFFASSKRKELENSLQKRDKSLNISTKEQSNTNEREDGGGDYNMKMAYKSQLAGYKPYGSAQDDSRDDPKDSRNHSLSIQTKEPKSASSVQKSSLSSFITKVEKGSALPIKAKRDDDSAGLAPTRPYLSLEDKPSTKVTRNASESLSNASTNASNADSRITFNKGKLNQQASTSSQEVAKQKAKSFGLSPALNKDNSRDQDMDEDETPAKDSFTYYISNLEKHHRNWDELDYFCQIYKEHFIQSFQSLTFCKYLKPVDPKLLAQKKVMLPKRPTHKDKKTVIFDLDETLIHCNESADMPCDVILPIKFPHGEIIEAGINVRPYALEILKEISQHFEVIVFTASHSCYANVVLDYLDPHKQYVHHRLFRESCTVTDEGVYVKDLRVFGNRNMQDMVLVDNAAYSYGYQVENGIPIIPFYDNKEDQELKDLIPYLKSLLNVKDCREVNRQTFKLHQYTMYDTIDKVLNKVVLQN